MKIDENKLYELFQSYDTLFQIIKTKQTNALKVTIKKDNKLAYNNIINPKETIRN